MEKELNAIQSEFEGKLNWDAYKPSHVNRETCDQSHAFSRFKAGNKKTLKEEPEANGIDVRQRLIEFYTQHYSSNVMSLCVLGKHSLDELYEMVVERLPFGQIPNRKIKLKSYYENLADHHFKREHLQKEIHIVPEKDRNWLQIAFYPFEWIQSLSKEDQRFVGCAQNYLASLFNKKHDGSISAELKDRRGGLVNSISLSYRGVFASLTKDAMNSEKIDEIIKTVFQFFKFAKKDGIQRWIYEERQMLNEIYEENREKEAPLSLVYRIATEMQYAKIEKLVKRNYSDIEFRPELIEQLIDHWTPDCMRITLTSKQFEGKTDRKEKHYGVHYSYEQIAQESIDRWSNVEVNEHLKLHEPNVYIPTDLELVEREAEVHEVPQLIRRDKLSALWFLQDNRFKTPRAFIGLVLMNPFNLYPAFYSPMMLYCKLVNESLKKFARFASSAGIHYCFGQYADGLILEVWGYSQKLPLLLGQILDQLPRFDFSRKRFEKIKENRIRDLKNRSKQSLKSLLNHYYARLTSFKYTNEEKLLYAEQVTFEEVESASKSFFSRLLIKMFVHGNVTRKDAESMESMVKDRLIDAYHTSMVWQSSFPVRRSLRLENDSFYIFDQISEEHHQNAILSTFQIGPWTPAEGVKTCLLVSMLKQKFFNKLRTEEQLAYSLKMSMLVEHRVLSITFLIQSSYKPQFLENRIEHFLKWAADHLNQLTDADFQTHKESLKACHTAPIRRQRTLSVKFWSHIVHDILDFEDFGFLEALESVTKEDVLELFDEHLVRNRRRLSIRITGTKPVEKSTGSKENGDLSNLVDKMDEMKVESKENGEVGSGDVENTKEMEDEELPKVG